ncbi:succinylglutamate desuccinylase/aspartoacylase family protein [Wenzhouxiangella sp. AB-CW3]|uniref:M14 family metallopeptidase n=1 Tax=Wenzhouxiangella sp. AB-CW3 TaxID=2771012 RepID=UPI00168A4555|nr:M14 family metallopeptidase [Wenzhouxiangella sp. AB-CW3]QOC21313.1 succinylglutamate desuccinylase/aspartoacylase family protein [Wenzhouxiangella sp. AB-CW3]
MLDHLPDGLLDCHATELNNRLQAPTVIHLSGRRPQPVFVSVLQHGNEVSGWDAVRRLLKGRYQRDPLPRSLILFIANVRAASRRQRKLTDQPDFNRCWPGSDAGDTPWHRMFADLTRHVRELRPMASIDIHNNSGENPHYAAVNRIAPQSLRLASMFSRTVIYFTRPRGVQSMAFGEFCPAVTLECGPPHRLDGTDHAMTFLDTILNLDQISDQAPSPENLELYEMIATVNVAPDRSFSFAPDGSSLILRPDLDRLNFEEVPPGTRLGRVNGDSGLPLVAVTHDGHDVSGEWFSVRDGDIVTSRPLMPAMLTTEERIIRQDCLCHLMERLSSERMETEHARHRSTLPEKRY